MRSSLCKVLVLSLFCIGVLFLPSSLCLAVQDHVVSPAELQQVTVNAARVRSQNLAKVEGFFSSKLAQQTLKSAHFDPVQVKDAIPSLSDQELAQLASKVDKVQKDFAAGALNNQQITYILIALATAVIVIILVR